MSTNDDTRELVLESADNSVLANLCGKFDEHLRQIEEKLGVRISNRGNCFRVTGPSQSSLAGDWVLRELFTLAGREPLDSHHVHMCLREVAMNDSQSGQAGDKGQTSGEKSAQQVVVKTSRLHIRPKGKNQLGYLNNIHKFDLSFGIGPAGTGKTYLAVASAVEALEQEEVRRIVLVRPAVEAGERLGFLPGDLSQKVDPYLRPMYDALYEMLGFDKVAKLVERNIIEVAPLAFMRGRSLNESFVILDEAQNTTVEQMKMFLTRMGFGSRSVVTGDITQIDLAQHQASGLRHAMQVLESVPSIGFSFFSPKDVVRHSLVQSIVEAYEKFENGGPSTANDRNT